ncbi:hypothetical protein [Anaerosinus massiliensis]|uniref:hypothetical protein n=1 Tax=Massilibacillus massiliensis TaxID=1806837 RepID=UPI000DA630DE|nr:hypothetical protein [Massilibacillus massiliensis]
MKKFLCIIMLTIICTLGFCNISEAKVGVFESKFTEPQSQFSVYLSYKDSSTLETQLSFSKGDKNVYWIFPPSTPPQVNIDGYIYLPTSYYHKNSPLKNGGYHSYASLYNIPLGIVQRILSANNITVTLFFENQDTLIISVPPDVLEEWKSLIELSWKN